MIWVKRLRVSASPETHSPRVISPRQRSLTQFPKKIPASMLLSQFDQYHAVLGHRGVLLSLFGLAINSLSETHGGRFPGTVSYTTSGDTTLPHLVRVWNSHIHRGRTQKDRLKCVLMAGY